MGADAGTLKVASVSTSLFKTIYHQCTCIFIEVVFLFLDSTSRHRKRSNSSAGLCSSTRDIGTRAVDLRRTFTADGSPIGDIFWMKINVIRPDIWDFLLIVSHLKLRKLLANGIALWENSDRNNYKTAPSYVRDTGKTSNVMQIMLSKMSSTYRMH